MKLKLNESSVWRLKDYDRLDDFVQQYNKLKVGSYIGDKHLNFYKIIKLDKLKPTGPLKIPDASVLLKLVTRGPKIKTKHPKIGYEASIKYSSLIRQEPTVLSKLKEHADSFDKIREFIRKEIKSLVENNMRLKEKFEYNEKSVAIKMKKRGYTTAIIFDKKDNLDILYTKSRRQAYKIMRTDFSDKKNYNIVDIDYIINETISEDAMNVVATFPGENPKAAYMFYYVSKKDDAVYFVSGVGKKPLWIAKDLKAFIKMIKNNKIRAKLGKNINIAFNYQEM